MTSEFKTEVELSEYITEIIKTTINNKNLEVFFKLEVSAPGCIPDMVLVEERAHSIHYLIAIEFKLSNWRRAIFQAFRYRNFGNESYVILDRKRANSAINNLEMFKRANVGLITVENFGELVSWFSPIPALPFSREFSYKVACSILSPRIPENDGMLFTTDVNQESSIYKLREIWA